MRRAAETLRKAANRINRRLATHAAPTLGLFPVLGFPRSGTTWLCQMLADALGVRFAQLRYTPALRPTVLHGHWPYDTRLRQVTFVIRDGRDTMVSFYFFHKIMHDAGETAVMRHLYPPGADLSDVRTNLPRFIEHAFRSPMGVRSDWATYNRAWLNRPGVVTARYESLRENPGQELARICAQLGKPSTPDQIAASVRRWSMDQVTGRPAGTEDRSSVVRKGAVGDWRNAFSQESCAVFAGLAGDALVELGYETSPDWRAWDIITSPDSVGGQ